MGVRVLAVFVGLVWLSAPAAPASAQGADGAFPAIEGPPPPVPPRVVARDAEGRVTLRATRIEAPLVIDGALDEPVYTTVEAIGDLVQQEPHEGEPATERTEAWVLYDGATLYISARCWESDPSARVANEMQRDSFNIFQNDHFGVILDTFRDRRNGFLFYVNAIGGLSDGLVTNESETNRDWNTVWRAKVSNFAGGWTVEMAIPFRSLRYAAGGAQVWGLNFRRAVRSKNEMDYLTRIPASFGRNAIARLSQAATLVGLEPAPSGANLEIKPYVTAGLRTDLENGVVDDPTRDAGLDLKYGLTRGLTLDVTYNTDFAQVEDDEQRVNLTRFSLFFPEKRDFFLEGQGIFSFGGARSGGPGGGGGGGPSDTPVLFFSRRIGLYETDDETVSVPVRAGARVTGKAGRFSVGLLNIQTGAAASAGAVSTNFSVVRVKRDVLRRSTIGFIGTRRGPTTDGVGANYVAGVDAGFSFFENLNLNTYFALTRTPGLTGDDRSYRAQLDYRADRYGLEVERLSVGANFNPEIGYLRRSDIRRSFVRARFSPRPTSIAAIRKLTWEGRLDYITDGRGALSTRETQGQFRIEFERGDEWQVEVTDAYERIDEEFEPADGIVIPVGGYDSTEVRTFYRLGPQRRISGMLNAARAGYYNGHRSEIGYRGRIEVTPRFSLEPGLSWNWVDVPQGAFTSNLISTRATLTLSPRMMVGALVQYVSSDNSVSSNVRYRWEYVPGSDLFVVYSEGRDTTGRGFPFIQNRTFIVKLAHLLRF